MQSDPSVTEYTCLQALRRSLKGPARQVIISLGEKATLSQILHKLSSMFASTSDNNNVMQEFFSAFQKTGEPVTTFACRLEGILTNAKDGSHLSMETRNEMLRCKFWTSLTSDQLKSQTRHKYDTVKEYEQLIKEVRTVEHEMSLSNVQSSAAAAVAKKTQQAAISAETELEKRMKALELKVDGKFDSLEKKVDEMLKLHNNNSSFSQQSSRRPYNNNNRGNNNRRFNNNGRYNNNHGNYDNNQCNFNNNRGNYNNNQGYNNYNNYGNHPKE